MDVGHPTRRTRIPQSARVSSPPTRTARKGLWRGCSDTCIRASESRIAAGPGSAARSSGSPAYLLAADMQSKPAAAKHAIRNRLIELHARRDDRSRSVAAALASAAAAPALCCADGPRWRGLPSGSCTRPLAKAWWTELAHAAGRSRPTLRPAVRVP